MDATGEIVAQTLTDSNADDGTVGVETISELNGHMHSITADAAYESNMGSRLPKDARRSETPRTAWCMTRPGPSMRRWHLPKPERLTVVLGLRHHVPFGAPIVFPKGTLGTPPVSPEPGAMPTLAWRVFGSSRSIGA